jgi:UDP-glucose 4-epimerase
VCTRFLFSSSRSLYGASRDAAVSEDAEFDPVTQYGECKVLAEQGISQLAVGPTHAHHATA